MYVIVEQFGVKNISLHSRRLVFFHQLMLRLFIGVVLGLVAVWILTGVDVFVTETFSGSESESWAFKWTACFLFKGAFSLSISFWFSASILERSNMISFLRDVFISVRLSGSILGTLLELATRFADGEFSFMEVSKSPETSSATAFLFWLLVVILVKREREYLWKDWILQRFKFSFEHVTIPEQN